MRLIPFFLAPAEKTDAEGCGGAFVGDPLSRWSTMVSEARAMGLSTVGSGEWSFCSVRVSFPFLFVYSGLLWGFKGRKGKDV